MTFRTCSCLLMPSYARAAVHLLLRPPTRLRHMMRMRLRARMWLPARHERGVHGRSQLHSLPRLLRASIVDCGEARRCKLRAKAPT